MREPIPTDRPGDQRPPDPDAAEDAVQQPAATTPGPFDRPARRPHPRFHLPVLAAIAAGGFVGGLARYAITRGWPARTGGFPWTIFLINTSGAFGLALLLVLVTEVWPPTRFIRPAIGTGFFGAFTTFSSVATSTDQLAAHGHRPLAVLYLGSSLFAGLAAASFGLVLGRAVATNRERRMSRAEGVLDATTGSSETADHLSR